MKLTSNKWHVRWFNFVQSVIGDKQKYSNGTNLCHFMRVTMVWGPLVIFVASCIAVLFATFFFVAPFYGVWSGPIFLGSVVGGLGVAYGPSCLAGKYGSKLAPVGSMAHCAYEHAKAVKGKFCPLIQFRAPITSGETAGTSEGVV